MFKPKTFALGLLVAALFISSLAFGGMRIELKNGKVIQVPVKGDEIKRITFDEEEDSTSGKLLETLQIPNDKPVKILSKITLEKGRWYLIEASGVISDWSHVKEGVDPVWCYAEWRCGQKGEVWDQLRIDGKGMTDIAGKPIPYNPQHAYQVRYLGQGKPVELFCSDAQGSWSDNSGSFTVKILE